MNPDDKTVRLGQRSKTGLIAKSVEHIQRIKTKTVEAVEERSAMSERRLAVCAQCNDYNADLKMCRVCSCIMPAKTLLKLSTCPKGYWL